MFKLLLQILKDEFGGTLAITRKTANTLITASGFNTNYDEIEAVVNGGIEAGNIAADAVNALKLNSDVVRANYGLLQHTDGSLYVDVYGVLVNAGTNGVEWGRAGDMLLSSSTTTPDGFTDVSATYADKFIRISATALSTGGADTHTHAVGSFTADSHILTTAEMPAHIHTIGEGANLYSGYAQFASVINKINDRATSSTGGGGAHNNLQPYIVKYVWQRTA